MGSWRETVDEVRAADGPVGPRHARPAGLEVAVHLDQGRVAERVGLDEAPVDVVGARPGPGADRGAVADRHRGFGNRFRVSRGRPRRSGRRMRIRPGRRAFSGHCRRTPRRRIPRGISSMARRSERFSRSPASISRRPLSSVGRRPRAAASGAAVRCVRSSEDTKMASIVRFSKAAGSAAACCSPSGVSAGPGARVATSPRTLGRTCPCRTNSNRTSSRYVRSRRCGSRSGHPHIAFHGEFIEHGGVVGAIAPSPRRSRSAIARARRPRAPTDPERGAPVTGRGTHAEPRTVHASFACRPAAARAEAPSCDVCD